MDLAGAIAAHLAEWEAPVVELAIFGTGNPPAIAAALEQFIAGSLGAPVAECLFYRTSVGAVAGVRLADGRRVVVKVHQPHVSRARLAAVHDVMAALAAPASRARGRWWRRCRSPTAWPPPGMIDGGELRDGHEPAVRRELAGRLAELVALVKVTPAREPLGAGWFSGLPAERLWPRPHSPLFDFERTAAGAESIDAIAAQARQAPRAGARVIGHFDWRAEHVRFEGDRAVAVYDWDSLHVDLEPTVVGAAAHAFCADWERADVPAAPSVDELRAFVGEYEDARGRRFAGDERRTLAGSLVYSLAYTARCVHALGADADDRGRAFVQLLEAQGAGAAARALIKGERRI